MEAEISLKKDWIPTPEAFDKMLGWLDDDRETAGEKYEKIRQKLIKLFKWRNCTPEEDYADITINRVTRRIFESAPVDVSNPYLYFHGTALNVIREFWRGQLKHKSEELEKLTEQKIEQEFDQAQTAKRFDCMKECLRQLPPESQEFIVKYHHGERKIDVRKEMAEKLQLPLNVLRIRASRIRTGLEQCVGKCLKKI